METGAIVGLVLGAVALVLMVGFLVYQYWWLPHQNKTRHQSGELDTDWDERTRHKLMETYGLSGGLDGAGAMLSVNDDDFSLRMKDNPYEFEAAL